METDRQTEDSGMTTFTHYGKETGSLESVHVPVFKTNISNKQ